MQVSFRPLIPAVLYTQVSRDHQVAGLSGAAQPWVLGNCAECYGCLGAHEYMDCIRSPVHRALAYA